MMNDDRNETEYSCGTVSSYVSQPSISNILDESDPTILYVVGKYQYMYVHSDTYVSNNYKPYVGTIWSGKVSKFGE